MDRNSYEYLTEGDEITVICDMGVSSKIEFLVIKGEIRGGVEFEQTIVHVSYDDLYRKIERACSPGVVEKIQIIKGSHSLDLKRETYDNVKGSDGLEVICTGREVPLITNGGRVRGRLIEAVLNLERRIRRLEGL